jgi:hypothetical protein
LPSVQTVRPKLIVCEGARVFDERRNMEIYERNGSKFYVQAATEQQNCAISVLRMVHDGIVSLF